MGSSLLDYIRVPDVELQVMTCVVTLLKTLVSHLDPEDGILAVYGRVAS